MSSDLPVEDKPNSGPAAALARIESAPAPVPAMPAGEFEDEPAGDPRRYLAAILRYKWILVLGTIVGAAAGVTLSQMQAPLYEAQATIWVELGAGPRGPIQEGQLLENTNWLDLLRSYAVLDSVVTERRLFVRPEVAEDSVVLRSLGLSDRFLPGRYELKVSGNAFALSRQNSGVVQRGTPGDSVGPMLGLRWVPPAAALTSGRTIAFTLTTPRQAALQVANNFHSTLPERDGNFIRMTLEGSAAAPTAATLNSIATHFVQLAADLKREKLRQLTNILQSQLTESADELRRAELALESFRVRTITEPSEQAPPVASGLQMTQAPALQNYFMMKTEADRLRRDRDAIDAAMVLPPDSGMTSLSLEGIQSVRDNADLSKALGDLTSERANIRALRSRYTDDNPVVMDALRRASTLERQNIPVMLRSLRNEIVTRENAVNARLGVTATDLRQIPRRSIEEARLSRDVQIAQQLYVSLQGRYSEARLADASSLPDVKILDPAVVPDRPIKNIKLALLGGGLAGGIGLAIVIALLLDHFDKRLRYPDQVTGGLNLPILGAIPRVGSNGTKVKDADAAQVVEALRTIRLNLLHAHGAAGPLITTITSPGSGDGKSFLSSNLAIAFADAGHRTLLIDGDIRRGALHRVLGLNRKPGLLDYLSGEATAEQIVQPAQVPSVDFIGCGTRKLGGPELLASAAMSQLLIALRSRYTAIIMDSAPLGAGVDPLVLGSLTGSLLLVLRTGMTDRALTAAKLQDVAKLPIRVLGAVLNDVKAEAGYYKYYSYLPGYGSDDEKGTSGRQEWVRRLSAGTGGSQVKSK